MCQLDLTVSTMRAWVCARACVRVRVGDLCCQNTACAAILRQRRTAAGSADRSGVRQEAASEELEHKLKFHFEKSKMEIYRTDE